MAGCDIRLGSSACPRFELPIAHPYDASVKLNVFNVASTVDANKHIPEDTFGNLPIHEETIEKSHLTVELRA